MEMGMGDAISQQIGPVQQAGLLFAKLRMSWRQVVGLLGTCHLFWCL